MIKLLVLISPLLLSACVPLYQTPSSVMPTAKLFLSGSEGFRTSGNIYKESSQCTGRQRVYGGIYGGPKEVIVEANKPITASIDIDLGSSQDALGTTFYACFAIGTFIPENGAYYTASGIVPQRGPCTLQILKRDSSGMDTPVATTQRKWKRGVFEESEWCELNH